MATLKAKTEVYLPGKLAARLTEAATEQGWTVDELVQDALQGFLRMMEEFGVVPERWRAVPIDADTEVVIKSFAEELGDAETLHLDTALMIFFHQAAETKRKTGKY